MLRYSHDQLPHRMEVTCPICLLELQDTQELVQCEHCHNKLHHACMAVCKYTFTILRILSLVSVTVALSRNLFNSIFSRVNYLHFWLMVDTGASGLCWGMASAKVVGLNDQNESLIN